MKGQQLMHVVLTITIFLSMFIHFASARSLLLKFDVNSTDDVVVVSELDVSTPGVGHDHINVSWTPDSYDPTDDRPSDDFYFIKYRPKGSSEWSEVEVTANESFTTRIDNLYPGTAYELITITVAKDKVGRVIDKRTSPSAYHVTTDGDPPTTATGIWFILLIVVTILIIIVLIIACLFVRKRQYAHHTNTAIAAPPCFRRRKTKRNPDGHYDESADDSISSQRSNILLPTSNKKPAAITRLKNNRKSVESGEPVSARSDQPSEADSMAVYRDEHDDFEYDEDASYIGQYTNTKTAVRTELKGHGHQSKSPTEFT